MICVQNASMSNDPPKVHEHDEDSPDFGRLEFPKESRATRWRNTLGQWLMMIIGTAVIVFATNWLGLSPQGKCIDDAKEAGRTVEEAWADCRLPAGF